MTDNFTSEHVLAMAAALDDGNVRDWKVAKMLRYLLSERTASAGEDTPVVDLRFGLGIIAVTTGHHHGIPCVYLAPAKQPGNVGESCVREDLPKDRMIEGESVLCFPTVEQAELVKLALCNQTDKIASLQAAQPVAIEVGNTYADGYRDGKEDAEQGWIDKPVASVAKGDVVARKFCLNWEIDDCLIRLENQMYETGGDRSPSRDRYTVEEYIRELGQERNNLLAARES